LNLLGKMAERIDEAAKRCCSNAQLKQKMGSKYDCILLCGKPCSAENSLDNITPDKWKSILEEALKWKGLDTLGNFHCSVDWKKGPKGHHMYHYCHTSVSSNVRILQAAKCKYKSEQSIQDNMEVSNHRNDSALQASSPKKLCFNTGSLHDKTHCIWCMKGDYHKSDKELLLLATIDAWTRFKLHTVFLEDKAMRVRIDTLIDFILFSNSLWNRKPISSYLLAQV